MVTEMVAALYDVSAQETLRTDVYVVTLAKAEPVSDRFGPLP
jgi:hypothetical protein